ncbi:MAG: DNA repair protein RecO [Gammaproteobacteria bacterium]|nr:DNA repair protein RecO [Gammaproteobacteria bacterium]
MNPGSKLSINNKSAVVLHSYQYRDTSLIVNLFLSEFGKIDAIAKGIKGPKSKKKFSDSVLLQPFQKINVSLAGKNELLTLTTIESEREVLDTNWSLSGKSLYCAYYINELLLRLLPSHIDCSEIFILYEKTLDHLLQLSLAEKDEDSSKILPGFETPLRVFELKLLEYLGYGLNFEHDFVTDQPIHSQGKYYYIIDSGPTERKPTGIHSLQISGSTLINMSNLQLTEQKTLQESKHLLRWILTEHLGGRPLKSREMFKQLYC